MYVYIEIVYNTRENVLRGEDVQFSGMCEYARVDTDEYDVSFDEIF